MDFSISSLNLAKGFAERFAEKNKKVMKVKYLTVPTLILSDCENPILECKYNKDLN